MPIQASSVVIIPTTGNPVLRQCVASVLAQTHQPTSCLVVVDGQQYESAVDETLAGLSGYTKVVLPWNTGAGGFNGQRIRAGFGPLVNEDVVLYCDEDNWFAPDHVESCILQLAQGNSWCYSLRMIASRDGSILGPDDCESLGRWPVWVNQEHHMVDTSCYCLTRKVAQVSGAAWITGGWGEDRQFYANLSRWFPDFGCTGTYTVNYRLGGNPQSVNWDFFQQGNAAMASRYPDGLPWQGGTIRV